MLGEFSEAMNPHVPLHKDLEFCQKGTVYSVLFLAHYFGLNSTALTSTSAVIFLTLVILRMLVKGLLTAVGRHFCTY